MCPNLRAGEIVGVPFPNKETQWKKGQSGNPKGHSEGRRQVDHLMRLIEDRNAGPAIMQVWLRAILERDFRYFKEFIDRIDGKVLERLSVEDATVVVERKDRKRKRKRAAPKRAPRRPARRPGTSEG